MPPLPPASDPPPAAQPVSSDDEHGDRIIDGLRYPREARQIDPLGFETTKHSLHFRGRDWDRALTRRREALTDGFLAGAAAATGEPRENVGGLRFVVVGDAYLHVKFTVRHRAALPAQAVQQRVADYDWHEVKQLYEPREKQHRPPKKNKKIIKKNTAATAEEVEEKQETERSLGASRRQQTTTTATGGGLPQNLSFFGRANVGPEGPQFEDEKDKDEEPAAYEEQVAARRLNSRLIATMGIV